MATPPYSQGQKLTIRTDQSGTKHCVVESIKSDTMFTVEEPLSADHYVIMLDEDQRASEADGVGTITTAEGSSLRDTVLEITPAE